MPVLNEAIALPGTLEKVFSQTGEFEVIVVDGGSTDNTRAIVQAYPDIKLLSAATGRASQMNAGAKQAKGEWLLFLHADTLLPADAMLAITSLPDSVQTGGFQHCFSGKSRGLRLISWLHNFRCRRTRVFYGDQAMFIRKTLFFEMGEFPEGVLMEDLILGERLVKVTSPLILEQFVITDSRKFEQHGIWLSLWRVILILLSHELHLPIPVKKFFANVR